jgi:hypothetical protein
VWGPVLVLALKTETFVHSIVLFRVCEKFDGTANTPKANDILIAPKRRLRSTDSTSWFPDRCANYDLDSLDARRANRRTDFRLAIILLCSPKIKQMFFEFLKASSKAFPVHEK